MVRGLGILKLVGQTYRSAPWLTQLLGRRRHSALGYLSPMAFERRNAIMAQKRSTPSPGQPNHAAVLAPIKHKPSRARKTRVLDRDCARRQSLNMGRDEGTGSAAAEPRNGIDKEDDAPIRRFDAAHVLGIAQTGCASRRGNG